MTRKKDKKQNALKHGIYSRAAILPGEKLADYEALRQAHYEEWVPDGVTEEYLVDDLCMLHWKKRRLDQYEQNCLQQRVDHVNEANENNRHIRNLSNLGAEFSEAVSIEATEQLLARLIPYYSETIAAWVPRESCEDLAKWGQQIGIYLSNLKTKDPLEGPDLFVAMMDPGSMHTEIFRSERLDEAIDRTIKRLMQVKAAKQVFPNMRKNARPELKLINASASAEVQPLALSANEPKPATQPVIMVSAKSETDRGATAQHVGIIEGAPAPASVSASISLNPTKKEHLNLIPVERAYFAKPQPASVEELNKFSSFCKSLSQRGGYSAGVDPDNNA